MFVLKVTKSILPSNFCFVGPSIILSIIPFIMSFIISCIKWFIIPFLRQLTCTALLDQQILYQPDVPCQGFLRWLKFFGLFVWTSLCFQSDSKFWIFSFDIFLLPSAFRLCVAPYKDSWGASICQQRPRVYFCSTQTMGVLCKGIFSSVTKLNQQIINSICTIQIDNDQYVQGGGKKLHGKQHWKHWKLLHWLLERGQFHHWPAQKGQHQSK